MSSTGRDPVAYAIGSPSGSSVLQHGPSTVATSQDGWWEEERATFIRGRLERLLHGRDSVIDVGCGTGKMLGEDRNLPGVFKVGVDSYRWPEWNIRNTHAVFVCAEADRLPFRDGAFDVVGSFDVLEHLGDDVGALREQRRVCSRSGDVVTAVPAFPRLWSAHDDAVGHQRRYTADSLAATASDAGLTVGRSTYFFSWLAPAALLLRNRGIRNYEPVAGDSATMSVVRWSIGLVCRLERAVAQRVRLPFGTSLWAQFRPHQSDT
jgi:SAM-dependent methyltransferase